MKKGDGVYSLNQSSLNRVSGLLLCVCDTFVCGKFFGGKSLQNVQFTFIYENCSKKMTISLKMYLVAHFS